jgi:hypothetical protein
MFIRAGKKGEYGPHFSLPGAYSVARFGRQRFVTVYNRASFPQPHQFVPDQGLVSRGLAENLPAPSAEGFHQCLPCFKGGAGPDGCRLPVAKFRDLRIGPPRFLLQLQPGLQRRPDGRGPARFQHPGDFFQLVQELPVLVKGMLQ